MEDTLDYEEGASMEPGLATGPVLYAAEEHPELQQLIQRNFTQEGDIELVRWLRPTYNSIWHFSYQTNSYVRKSSGIERTRVLAQSYADKARDIVRLLPESDAKTALAMLPDCVLNRTW